MYRRILSVCMVSLIMMMGVQVFAQENGRPDIQLPAMQHGKGAIQAIGDKLPALAKHYNMTPQQLKDEMLNDLDLWIDAQGCLLYLCEGMVVPEGAGEAEIAEGGEIPAAGPAPLDQTFLLHSRPSATRKIYLDFDGHVTSGTSWNNNYNGGADIVTPAYSFEGDASFSDAEKERIQFMWKRVSEDYAPFDVDVTTEDPGVEALSKSGTNDVNHGIRVVIGGSSFDWLGASYGGYASYNSLNWNSDHPCFVFPAQLGNGNEKYTAECISHETGHTVGLRHDGLTDGTTYYRGHGNWAPIMGAGYSKAIVQFSKGEYNNANNTQDDLAVMSGSFISYRVDDHGDANAQASWLSSAGGVVNGSGVIERADDVDVFAFVCDAGSVTLNISADPDNHQPNLDILAELYDDNNNLIVSSNPSGLPASITATVAGGTYYLHIDGVGTGNPATGYSDYASLGQFTISGTVVEPTGGIVPVAQASATPDSGDTPLVVAFSSSGSADPDGTIVSYSWDFDDGSSSTAQNPSYTYTVAGSFNAVLAVIDNDGYLDTSTVTITVTTPNAPPTAGVTALPTSGDMPLVVNFDGSSSNDSDGTIVAYDWVFGDGNTGSGVTASNTYTAEGSYTATLTVTDDRGDSDSTSLTIDVIDPSKVDAPSGLAAAVNGGTVDLTWTDNAGNEEGYTIERAKKVRGKYNYSVVGQVGANVTSFADSPGIGNYRYRVQAFNNTTGAVSAYSNIVSVTVETAGDPSPPLNAPSNLSAGLAGNTVTLIWTDNSDNENGFTVERGTLVRRNKKKSRVAWEDAGSVAANTITFSETLASGDYYYRVKAFDSTSTSDTSNEVSVTIP